MACQDADSCTVLPADRGYIIDLSVRGILSPQPFPYSTPQYPYLASRWCASFRFPRFPLTEPCLLTRDLRKRSGVGLPNLSSPPPPQHPSEHPFHLCHLPHRPPPPPPLNPGGRVTEVAVLTSCRGPHCSNEPNQREKGELDR